MSTTCLKLSRARSSVGLGGTGPASNRSRFGLLIPFLICESRAFSVTLSSVRSEVIPSLRSLIPKSRPKAGLRISRPQRMTFLPRSANDTAKLAALKVLPSPEVLEVKRITFSSPFSINCMLVRIERKISSIWLFLLACTTIPAESLTLSEATATSAMIGRSVRRARSSWPSIL